jgi:fatty acid desaturase
MTSGLALRSRAIEWPTMILAMLIYGFWAILIWVHASVPAWALVPVGSWLIAWHGSLQHETIHGHPTRIAWVNALVGGLPLALWLPYGRYQRDHIAHHATEHVTDPVADPESRYLVPATGVSANLRSVLATLQGPLPGRLLIGPLDEIARFLVGEVGRLGTAPLAVARDWLPHLLGLAIVGAWLVYCHMSLGLYLVAFVYPGTALSLLRSFAEHRAAEYPEHRVAVVERAGPLAILFLNNNLHAAHHRAPGLSWFHLPAFYRRHRAAILKANGGLRYDGYGEILRRYWRRPHDVAVHPSWQ